MYQTAHNNAAYILKFYATIDFLLFHCIYLENKSLRVELSKQFLYLNR